MSTVGNPTQEEKLQLVRENMERIKHKIMVMSGKGGVGKSTVAVNLAWGLRGRGQRVGLLDADLHGPSVPWMLGIKENELCVRDGRIEPTKITEGFYVVSIGGHLKDNDRALIWRGPIKMGVIQQFLGEVNWGDLDFLVVDAPPGTGDEPLSVAQLVPAITGVIIVTSPQAVALLDARKSVTFARQLGLPVMGVVENMSGFICPHCHRKVDLFGSGGGEKAAREMDVPFLGRIPFDPVVVLSGDEGHPLLQDEVDTQTTGSFKDIVSKVVAFSEGNKIVKKEVAE